MNPLLFRCPPEYARPLLRGLARISWVNVIFWIPGALFVALLGADWFVDGFLVSWIPITVATGSAAQTILLLSRKRWWQDSVHSWRNVYSIAMFVNGVSWSFALVGVAPGAEETVNFLVTAVLIATSASAIVSFAGSKLIAGSFLAGQWGSAAILWAMQPSILHVSLALFIGVAAFGYHHIAFTLLVRGERALKSAEALAGDMAVQTIRDALTRTLNRNGILLELNAQLSAGHAPGILFLDLDGFKAVNDTLGHHVGDELLCAVADEIQYGLAGNGILGRLGGDEFIVLTTDTTQDALVELGVGLVDAIRVRCENTTTLPVTASMGVAMSVSGDTPETLLHRADMAMYDAKALGGNNLVRLAPGEHSNRERQEILERELRFAILSRQIDFHAQPILSLDSGEWRSIELLARWNQPGVGPLSPGVFIPLAESLELDRELGLCAIEAAAAALTRSGSCKVSINITSPHFVSGHLLEDILSAAADHHIDPSGITVEITESQTLSDLDIAADVADGLRAHGINLAIDDFGSGYSSLMLLGRLPLTTLKLAPEFGAKVMEPSGQVAVRHLVSWADSLGLDLVVEGVEEEPIADLLRSLGVAMAQGYLFARPAPLDEVLNRLSGEADLAA